jgi:hypothetical protein
VVNRVILSMRRLEQLLPVRLLCWMMIPDPPGARLAL